MNLKWNVYEISVEEKETVSHLSFQMTLFKDKSWTGETRVKAKSQWKMGICEVRKYYKERLMVELQSRYIEASNRFSDNLITEIKGNWADEVGEISGSVEIENEGAEDHWSVNLRK